MAQKSQRTLLRSLSRNRGALVSLGVLGVFSLVALLAPWLSPYDPSAIHEGFVRLPPTWMNGGDVRFLLGTDDIGRDLLSRLIFGSRISLGIGLLSVLLSGFLGILFGLTAGYIGGRTDHLIMRMTDILMSLPSILLAIVVVAVLGPSLFNAIVAVSVVALPGFIRIVRGAVLNEKSKAYISACRSFGAGHGQIALRNILPNCLAPIIVTATLGFSDGILNAAALGFLGLGAQPPTPEWGVMLSDARAYIESAWWLVTLPGLCILIIVLCFNLVGDGLRDALDPKLK